MNMTTADGLSSSPACLRRWLKISALFAVLIVFNGCASKQSEDSWDEGSKRKSAVSNTSMGLEYMNRGQNEIALGKLKKAIKSDPNYAPAYTVTAVLYERLGEMELAGKNYKKAYDVDPENGDTNNNYGVYLCKTDRSALAMTHFLNAIDDPFYSSPEVALANAGSCALEQKNYADADEYLRAALKLDSGFPDALIDMAKLNYVQENSLTSRAFIQRYEAVSAHDSGSLLLAIKIELAANNSKAASAYLVMLETRFPDSDQTAEARRITGR